MIGTMYAYSTCSIGGDFVIYVSIDNYVFYLLFLFIVFFMF